MNEPVPSSAVIPRDDEATHISMESFATMPGEEGQSRVPPLSINFRSNMLSPTVDSLLETPSPLDDNQNNNNYSSSPHDSKDVGKIMESRRKMARRRRERRRLGLPDSSQDTPTELKKAQSELSNRHSPVIYRRVKSVDSDPLPLRLTAVNSQTLRNDRSSAGNDTNVLNALLWTSAETKKMSMFIRDVPIPSILVSHEIVGTGTVPDPYNVIFRIMFVNSAASKTIGISSSRLVNCVCSSVLPFCKKVLSMYSKGYLLMSSMLDSSDMDEESTAPEPRQSNVGYGVESTIAAADDRTRITKDARFLQSKCWQTAVDPYCVIGPSVEQFKIKLSYLSGSYHCITLHSYARNDVVLSKFRDAVSDAILSSILDTTVDGVVLANEIGTIYMINSSVCKMFGYERSEELVGQNVSILVAEPHRSQHDLYLKRFHETGVGRIIGTPGRNGIGRRRDNSEFSLSISISEFRNSSKERMFAAIIRDRSGDQDALNEIHNLQCVVDGCREALLCVSTDDLRIVIVNSQAVNLFGLEGVKQGIPVYLNDTLREGTVKEIQRIVFPVLLLKGNWFGLIPFVLPGSGAVIAFRVKCSFFEMEDKKRMVSFMCEDIRDERRENLRVSCLERENACLGHLLNNINDLAIAISLPDLRICYANTKACERLGINLNSGDCPLISDVVSSSSSCSFERDIVPSVMSSGSWAGSFSFSHLSSKMMIRTHTACFGIDHGYVNQVVMSVLPSYSRKSKVKTCRSGSSDSDIDDSDSFNSKFVENSKEAFSARVRRFSSVVGSVSSGSSSDEADSDEIEGYTHIGIMASDLSQTYQYVEMQKQLTTETEHFASLVNSTSTIVIEFDLENASMLRPANRITYINKTGKLSFDIGHDSVAGVPVYFTDISSSPRDMVDVIVPECLKNSYWSGTLKLKHFRTYESLIFKCTAFLSTYNDSGTNAARDPTIILLCSYREDLVIANKNLNILKLGVDSMDEYVTICDFTLPDYPIVYGNKSFWNMCGYSPSKKLGTNLRFLQGPRTDATTKDRIRDAIARGSDITVEILNYRRDGREFWNMLSIFCIRDEYSKQITKFVSVSHEINVESRSSEFSCENLIEAGIKESNEGYFVFQSPADGYRILYANNTFLRILNLSKEATIGKVASDVLSRNHQGATSSVEKITKAVSSSNLKPVTVFFPINKRHGKDVWVRITISPVLLMDENSNYQLDSPSSSDEDSMKSFGIDNKKEKNYQFVGILSNFTRFKERLNSMILDFKLAEKHAKTTGLFLTRMGHMIRTPLNSICGLTYLLIQMTETEHQKELLSAIRKSSEMLALTLSELVDSQKAISSSFFIQRHAIRVRPFLESCVEVMANEALLKGLEIALMIYPDVPQVIRGDETRLRQALLHLLSNAVTYTDKGKVSVLVSVNDKNEEKVSALSRKSNSSFEIVFSVVDTGRGLSQDLFDRLTAEVMSQKLDDLRRRNSTTDSRPLADESETSESMSLMNKSSILRISEISKLGRSPKSPKSSKASLLNTSESSGITQCKVIVDSWHGAMSMTSGKDGTTVKFTFPCARPVGTNLRASDDTLDSSMAFQGLNCLVVDDNAINSQVLCMYLTRWGFETVSFSSGLEALQHIRTSRKYFSLIVLDYLMPNMTGVDVVRKVREYEKVSGVKRAQILLFSSMDVVRRQDRADVDVMFDAVLMKPIRPHLFFDTISEMLSNSEIFFRKSSVGRNRSENEFPPLPAMLLSSASLSSHENVSGKNCKLLVVEDNPTNVLVVAHILEELGLAVSAVARDGVEAVDIVKLAHSRNNQFDIILTDFKMPKMDGITATKLILSDESIIPKPVVFGLSACFMESDIEDGFNSGMVDVVTKPIDPSRLAEALKKCSVLSNHVFPERFRLRVAVPSAAPSPLPLHVVSTSRSMAISSRFFALLKKCLPTVLIVGLYILYSRYKQRERRRE